MGKKTNGGKFMKRTKVLLTILALILGIAMLTACEDRAADITDKPEKKTTSAPTPTDSLTDDPFGKDSSGDNGGDPGKWSDVPWDQKGKDNNNGKQGNTVTTDPFGVDIPENGVVNYEYVVYKIVCSDGSEITNKDCLPMHSWSVSYGRTKCELCIPLNDYVNGHEAIGTKVFPIEPNLTSGTFEFTEYNDQGDLSDPFTLTVNIGANEATLVDESGNTYYCSLYRTFTYKGK